MSEMRSILLRDTVEFAPWVSYISAHRHKFTHKYPMSIKNTGKKINNILLWFYVHWYQILQPILMGKLLVVVCIPFYHIHTAPNFLFHNEVENVH